MNYVLGIGIVAAVGVAAGILLAPKSGKKTREDLSQKASRTVESIKDTVQEKEAAIKDSAANAAQDVRDTLKDVHGKTAGVKKEIKDGYREIKEDIHKTAANISSGLNQSVK